MEVTPCCFKFLMLQKSPLTLSTYAQAELYETGREDHPAGVCCRCQTSPDALQTGDLLGVIITLIQNRNLTQMSAKTFYSPVI